MNTNTNTNKKNKSTEDIDTTLVKKMKLTNEEISYETHNSIVYTINVPQLNTLNENYNTEYDDNDARANLINSLLNKEIKKEIKRGDLIRNAGDCMYWNDGLYIYDGIKVNPLCFSIDESGRIPPDYTVFEGSFHPGYWDIAHNSNRNFSIKKMNGCIVKQYIQEMTYDNFFKEHMHCMEVEFLGKLYLLVSSIPWNADINIIEDSKDISSGGRIPEIDAWVSADSSRTMNQVWFNIEECFF
jgi:hypothetical protein